MKTQTIIAVWMLLVVVAAVCGGLQRPATPGNQIGYFVGGVLFATGWMAWQFYRRRKSSTTSGQGRESVSPSRR